MTADEEVRLLDELLDVLDRVVETSGCRDMVPLWMIATRSAREEHFRTEQEPVPEVPAHIQAWAKSMRSKYAALAAWRHASIAEGVLEMIEARHAEAVSAMYFTPCEKNAPPYSWSKASSRHPEVIRWSSPSTLDLLAQRGCRDSVRKLRVCVEKLRLGASPYSEAQAAILETGAREGTLRDVLRYADIEQGRDEP